MLKKKKYVKVKVKKPKKADKKKKQSKEVTIEPFPGAQKWRNYYTNTYYYNNYIVSVADDHSIFTTVAVYPLPITNWLRDIHRIYRRHLFHLVAGFHLDRRYGLNPKSPFSVLTLCVGSHCLVVDIDDGSEYPERFCQFLQNRNVFLVGVGTGGWEKKLEGERGLQVGRVVDLVPVAEKWAMRVFPSGVHHVAAAVLGERYGIEKPKRLMETEYNGSLMEPEQVKHACVEAFLCFEIGKKLLPRFCHV